VTQHSAAWRCDFGASGGVLASGSFSGHWVRDVFGAFPSFAALLKQNPNKKTPAQAKRYSAAGKGW
jgi:hypothetical protein